MVASIANNLSLNIWICITENDLIKLRNTKTNILKNAIGEANVEEIELMWIGRAYKTKIMWGLELRKYGLVVARVWKKIKGRVVG